MDGLFVTVTAPGNLPDDFSKECWNETAAACWNRLRTSLTRTFAGARLEYFKVAEYQKRGVWHFHALVRGVRFIPQDVLSALAVRAGFGPVCWVEQVRHRGGAAKYLSKYLLKDVERFPAGRRVFTESRGWRLDWMPLVRKPRDETEVSEWRWFRCPADLFSYLNEPGFSPGM